MQGSVPFRIQTTRRIWHACVKTEGLRVGDEIEGLRGKVEDKEMRVWGLDTETLPGMPGTHFHLFMLGLRVET